MKKLFLLFAGITVAASSNAQLNSSSMLHVYGRNQNSTEQKGLRPQPVNVNGVGTKLNAPTTARRGTGDHQRVYNYVDYLSILNADVFDNANLPYFWYNNDMYGLYQGNAGLERDTITFNTYGVVVQPSWSGYNDIGAYPTGTMNITTSNAFTVDSAFAYGIYGRNRAKTSIVDTLRFAITYGNGSGSNIGLVYYTGMASRYTYDTVRSAMLGYDANRRTLGKYSATGTGTIVYKDVYLKSTDTSADEYSRFGVPVALSVPAGNLVGVSVTFKSGEVYTPYSDTAFVGSANASTPYKYGMFRPLIVSEDPTAYPTYTPGNYNSGQFVTLPQTGTSYYPTWAWSTANGASSFQFPYVDLVLSCATCFGLNIANIPGATIGNIFPNPANNTVSVPVTMKETASVNVTLSNTIGQALATQNLGQLSANQTKNATFNTSSIANGIYFLTVEANGARTTSRFVVAH